MRRIAGVAAALCAIGIALPASAVAGTSWKSCEDDSGVLCAGVRVPLDRTGKVRGSLSLHVERVPARARPNAGLATAPRGAIVALAGGPGQPSTLFTSDFAFAFGDRRAGRDVVAFDQRGTGRSGLLRCPSVEHVALLSQYPKAGADCARRLGDKRGLYTTSDSVDDLEAVRQALGVDRIAIYGASYGTKVALAYAVRYPTHVERLILDSVLPLDGPDPLYADTLGAMARVQSESCGTGCAFTRDPAGDLAQLGAQLASGPARGYVVDARGRRQPVAIGSTRLFFLMLAGDFAPELRAALPAAIWSASRGDPAQLLRLAAVNEAGGEPAPPEEFATAVYTATLCEESPLPWPRSAPFQDRPQAAADAAAARGAGAFGPLGAAAVLQTDLLALCERWPEASAAPVLSGPLPDVPILVLEGALDLRTPAEGARRAVAGLSHVTFVTVPATGHSTLGSDTSDCTLAAIGRFLRRHTPRATCADPPLPLTPAGPVPLRLAQVPGLRGAPRPVARVLSAVGLTLDDVESQAATKSLLAFVGGGPGTVRGGGLRGGRFRVGSSGVSVASVVFIPGVRVSGRLLNRAMRIGSFRVSASGKRGTIAYHGGGIVSGDFDGRSFRFKVPVVDDGKPPTIQLGRPQRPLWPAVSGSR